MAKRNTVWVLWESEGVQRRRRFNITSKGAWQKEVDYLRHTNETLAARKQPLRERTLRHLTESTDKELLLTMLGLLEK